MEWETLIKGCYLFLFSPTIDLCSLQSGVAGASWCRSLVALCGNNRIADTHFPLLEQKIVFPMY